MHVKRVIKEVVKSPNYEESFYSEMDALKQIRHTNIPIVYDVDLDTKNYYIIEEYIEGKSLYDIVMQQGTLSEERTVEYGKQLTNLITFLHSRKPYPILFLDLQPKNIIISGGNLFLIDFGSSMFAGKQDKTIVFGTPGFAAPEQYQGNNIGVETDIYGIGALLYFMLTGKSLADSEFSKSNRNISQILKQIIYRCVEKRASLRYENTQVLYDQLSYLQNQKCKAYKEDKPLVISVAGIDKNVGTTQVCLLMNQYLCNLKVNHIYQENNDSNHIRNFARLHSDCMYSKGIFTYKKQRLVPKYSDAVELVLNNDIIIRDEGVYNSKKEYGDRLFIVLYSSEWEIEKIKNQLLEIKQYDGLIWNLSTRQRESIIYRLIQDRNYFVGYEPDITELSSNTTQFFENLFEEVLGKIVVKTNEKKAKKGFFSKLKQACNYWSIWH